MQTDHDFASRHRPAFQHQKIALRGEEASLWAFFFSSSPPSFFLWGWPIEDFFFFWWTPFYPPFYRGLCTYFLLVSLHCIILSLEHGTGSSNQVPSPPKRQGGREEPSFDDDDGDSQMMHVKDSNILSQHQQNKKKKQNHRKRFSSGNNVPTSLPTRHHLPPTPNIKRTLQPYHPYPPSSLVKTEQKNTYTPVISLVPFSLLSPSLPPSGQRTWRCEDL